MKKLLIFGLGVVVLVCFTGLSAFSQSNETVLPSSESAKSVNPVDSKMQVQETQVIVSEQSKTAIVDQQKVDETNLQIRAKKIELENSTDPVRKAILNDEIQQLQDELKILENPPVEIKSDPKLNIE